MLSRVLEPEVMDTPEEAVAYDAMNHSEVNRIFVDDLLAAYAERDVMPAGEMLDLGTGTALIPIELCRRAAEVRVVALDMSLSMLEVARINVGAANLHEQILLVHEDAKDLPHEDGRFAAVISNSIVHHIPGPAAVLAEGWRVLQPGGLMFVRDLLRPPDDATVSRLVETYAPGSTEHQRKMFDDSLRAALSLDEVRELVSALNVSIATVQQSSDRHWTWQCWKSTSQ
jgi:ubiquinone/menaquinone biosynthesis C-methylase UbiE